MKSPEKRGAWNLEIHFRFNYFRYILYWHCATPYTIIVRGQIMIFNIIGKDNIDEDEDDFTGVAPVDRYDDFSVFGKYFGIYADWAFNGYF